MESKIEISLMIKVLIAFLDNTGFAENSTQRSGGLIGSDLELFPLAVGDNAAEFTSKDPPSPDFSSSHI